jgi:hypothetical protein
MAMNELILQSSLQSKYTHVVIQPIAEKKRGLRRYADGWQEKAEWLILVHLSNALIQSVPRTNEITVKQ